MTKKKFIPSLEGAKPEHIVRMDDEVVYTYEQHPTLGYFAWHRRGKPYRDDDTSPWIDSKHVLNLLDPIESAEAYVQVLRVMKESTTEKLDTPRVGQFRVSHARVGTSPSKNIVPTAEAVETHATDHIPTTIASNVITNDEPAADSEADVSTEETVEQSDFSPVDITGKTAGIVSRKRVDKYGEVMTPQWLIDKMIESDEWKRDEDDTKLPSDMFASCFELGFGQGGFLLTTLKAKIKNMEKRFDLSKNTAGVRRTYRRGLLWILTTISGIEIQQDNVDYTREHMLDVMKEAYVSYYGINNDPWKKLKHFIDNANAIIEHNLIQGDALAMVDANGNVCHKVTYQPVMTRNNKLVVITPNNHIPKHIGIHVSDFHGEPLIDGVHTCILDKITAAFETIDEELSTSSADDKQTNYPLMVIESKGEENDRNK